MLEELNTQLKLVSCIISIINQAKLTFICCDVSTTAADEDHTDHVCRENHTIDWKEYKVVAKESDRFTGWIREPVVIRKTGNKAMNLQPLRYLRQLTCFRWIIQRKFKIKGPTKTTDVVETSQLIEVGFARLIIEIMNTSEPKSIFKIVLCIYPSSSARDSFVWV